MSWCIALTVRRCAKEEDDPASSLNRQHSSVNEKKVQSFILVDVHLLEISGDFFNCMKVC